LVVSCWVVTEVLVYPPLGFGLLSSDGRESPRKITGRVPRRD